MFTSRKWGGGNRYTLISILIILVIVYVFKLASPQKEVAYPDIIQYNGFRYLYVGTDGGSPLMFTRSKPAGREGYLILARRGISTSEAIYIYEGYLKYRRYVILKE